MSRVVDHDKFRAHGGIIDWLELKRSSYGKMRESYGSLVGEQQNPITIQLRWAFDASLGYPVRPFTVWSRGSHPADTPISYSQTPFGLMLAEACVDVLIDIDAPTSGVALAFTGMPLATGAVAWTTFNSGTSTIRLTGPGIQVVTLPWDVTIVGVSAATYAVQDDPAWQRVEIVGLPTYDAASSFTDLTMEQGLISALTSPVDASLQRFSRGAPRFGWDDFLPSGVSVPSWQLADPLAMIKVFNMDMLDDFIDMCDNYAPSQQQLQTYDQTLVVDAQHAADASFNPLRTFLYGGLSDPLAALVLGLGTAYPINQDGELTLAEAPTAGGWDFMITGLFRDDLGHVTERAALILGLGRLTPPPPPAAMSAVSPGVQAPAVLDDPNLAVVRVSWDAVSPLLPFDVGSFAFARHGTNPTTGGELLMTARPLDSALQPVGASRNVDTPDRASLADATWKIDPTIWPNDITYAVATQNIFGLWSPWSEVGISVQEPPLSPVTVTAAQMNCVPGDPCPATLQLDLTWNWTSRSPDSITLAAREFGQVWATDQPSDTSLPTADLFAITGAGILVTLTFDTAGDITYVTAGSGLTADAQHLTVDGQHVSSTPIGDRNTRRYRVDISGFSLDFDASARWGVALWATGVEHQLPHRQSDPGNAVVVSAADPRPPVITHSYDDVTLASMRDGEGLHHAQLSWSAMAGAVGYQVYTCSESTFRDYHGQPEQSPTQTLRDRLADLQSYFGANPDRRPFTRVGTTALTDLSTQVTLPRGTKDIHMYLVIGVSAGNVESAWPTTADPLCSKRFVAFAAPTLVVPAAPALEVRRGSDGAPTPTYNAQVRIASAAGAQVSRIDLYRVRVPEAAVQVETMGPPIVSLTGSAAGYSVTATEASGSGLSDGGVAQALGVINGTDPVPGSWKPVYYRAVAWGTDDASRGQYGGRSAPSTPRSVVVPPPDAPDLTSPTVVLPTPGSADARIDFGTSAPVDDTVLGPHLIEAEALLVTAAGVTTPVPLNPSADPLSQVPSTPPASAAGLWRDATTAGDTALHLAVPRADPSLSLSIRLRITDPIGRITEKLVDVPPGAAPIPHEIINPVLSAGPSGWLLLFSTDAPDSVAEGPLMLEVAFHGSLHHTSANLSSPLADLDPPPPDPSDILLGGSPALPAFITPLTASGRTVGIGFRHTGSATISIVAPDGTSSTITRTIGHRRIWFP